MSSSLGAPWVSLFVAVAGVWGCTRAPEADPSATDPASSRPASAPKAQRDISILGRSDGAAQSIQVTEARVRAMPPAAPNSAAFVVLSNEGEEAALVAAESPACAKVELHTHIQEGDMMKMRPVEHIELPAGKTIRLEPGGLHIMLIDLTGPLNPGDRVPLRLAFQDDSHLDLEVPVVEIGAASSHEH